MKKNIVILTLGLILFFFAAVVNVVDFIKDYLIGEFNLIALVKCSILFAFCALLILFYVKRIFFTITSIALIAGFITYEFVILKPHGDCIHNYIYKGSIEFSNIDSTSTYTIALQDIGDILFDSQVRFPDSLNVFCKIIINDTVEIINSKQKKDIVSSDHHDSFLFKCYDSIISGQFHISSNYFCDCEIDRKEIKRIENYPIRIYRDGVIYLDTVIKLPYNQVYDSIEHTVVNFGNIKINNVPNNFQHNKPK